MCIRLNEEGHGNILQKLKEDELVMNWIRGGDRKAQDSLNKAKLKERIDAAHCLATAQSQPTLFGLDIKTENCNAVQHFTMLTNKSSAVDDFAPKTVDNCLISSYNPRNNKSNRKVFQYSSEKQRTVTQKVPIAKRKEYWESIEKIASLLAQNLQNVLMIKAEDSNTHSCFAINIDYDGEEESYDLDMMKGLLDSDDLLPDLDQLSGHICCAIPRSLSNGLMEMEISFDSSSSNSKSEWAVTDSASTITIIANEFVIKHGLDKYAKADSTKEVSITTFSKETHKTNKFGSFKCHAGKKPFMMHCAILPRSQLQRDFILGIPQLQVLGIWDAIKNHITESLGARIRFSSGQLLGENPSLYKFFCENYSPKRFPEQTRKLIKIPTSVSTQTTFSPSTQVTTSDTPPVTTLLVTNNPSTSRNAETEMQYSSKSQELPENNCSSFFDNKSEVECFYVWM